MYGRGYTHSDFNRDVPEYLSDHPDDLSCISSYDTFYEQFSEYPRNITRYWKFISDNKVLYLDAIVQFELRLTSIEREQRQIDYNRKIKELEYVLTTPLEHTLDNGIILEHGQLFTIKNNTYSITTNFTDETLKFDTYVIMNLGDFESLKVVTEYTFDPEIEIDFNTLNTFLIDNIDTIEECEIDGFNFAWDTAHGPTEELKSLMADDAYVSDLFISYYDITPFLPGG